MSKKTGRIAELIAEFQGRELSANYLGFIACFNRGLFYEAHDVLEELWLADRKGPPGNFYKGLIQFAGAFVHLQKDRLRPAAALFKLARANFSGYPGVFEHMDVGGVARIIDHWLAQLEEGDFTRNPLTAKNMPQLALV